MTENYFVIVESDIANTIKRLYKRGIIKTDGTLKETIKRKKDILMYMLYLWPQNKSKLNELGNKRLSKKRINKLIVEHSKDTLLNIISELNKRILDDHFIIKRSFDDLTKVDYENTISYLDEELIKCQTKLNSYKTINIKPNVKFLTGDVYVPKDSVSITFTSKRIMEK